MIRNNWETIKGDSYENSNRYRQQQRYYTGAGSKIRYLCARYAFMINGEMFYEGVNLTHEEFFRQMEEGADITTSQPSPGEVTDFWDKLLKEYDEIFIYSHVQRFKRFLPDSYHAGR